MALISFLLNFIIELKGNDNTIITYTTIEIIYLFIELGLIEPVMEEITFRSMILNLFMKKYSPWISSCVTALIFGLFHFISYGFIGGISAIISGLLLNYIFIKYNSLISSLIFHSSYNIVVILMQIIGGQIAYKYAIAILILLPVLFLIMLIIVFNDNRIKKKN